MSTVTVPGLSASATASLQRFRDELVQAAGQNLVALMVAGEDRGNVRVFIVVERAGRAELEAITPALSAARKSVPLAPMILTGAEIERSADVFPTKFLAVQRRHVLLAGKDPFAGLTLSREHLRLRVEQELRNLSLRLRARLSGVATAPSSMALALSQAVDPLASALAFLLELSPAGAAGLPEDAAGRFERAARAFDLDGASLEELVALRKDGPGPRDLTSMYFQLLDTLDRVIRIVDGLEVR